MSEVSPLDFQCFAASPAGMAPAAAVAPGLPEPFPPRFWYEHTKKKTPLLCSPLRF